MRFSPHKCQLRADSGQRIAKLERELTATILPRRRMSALRPIRFTHSMRINPAQAINMADTIESSADKT